MFLLVTPKTYLLFFQIVKPFLEPKTRNKVKFVYSDDASTKKIIEDLFDMEHLDSAFGGKSNAGFDITKYAERMKEDDKRMPAFWSRGNPPSEASQPALPPDAAPSVDSIKLNTNSDASDNENRNSPTPKATESEAASPNHSTPTATGSTNPTEELH